jgi:four helix bundle protein
MARGNTDLVRTLPPGMGELRDQLLRAAVAVLRHIAEGASRFNPADRRARFSVARGECAECDASLDAVQLLGADANGRAHELRVLADRVGAMLTGLIQRETNRAGRQP